MKRIISLSLACVICFNGKASAADSAAAMPALTVPEGFKIELAAGPPLIERPIVAAFDDDGRLYVAESSGSNDPVEVQQQQRPHRIVRLEDADGDGKFDKRTVFADRMMFPEGAMFLDGSLYVSAAPSIWKLTDADGDGVADNRVEWFQAKTLTGCANDLHGPYAGPDGWIYWCKGAFAEQTHVVRGRPWTTRAAHVFRCRPDGSDLEPVITGGMDNPVDVVFTPEGEPILSATFLEGDGRRDGLVHAVYGGVFGKQHGVLEGHPRTGELMPPLVLMSPAAPCGLERYDSDVFGADFRDNFFLCQFNLRKVSRHILQPAGSSYASKDLDFVTSDYVDFHPTDVLSDADGSLLIVDTGGWYKLCCPTSQLWKPDVLGGVYRVRRTGAQPPHDPRGHEIAWSAQSAKQLWDLLADVRPAVRQRSSRLLASRRDAPETKTLLAELGTRSVETMLTAANPNANGRDLVTSQTALARTWALAQLDIPESQALIRKLLTHPDEFVRHATLHTVGLVRDAQALPQLLKLAASDTPANRRAAAEALGRIGDGTAIPYLLAASAKADDRFLQHSTIYALIELANPTVTAGGLMCINATTRAITLIAHDQMPGGKINPAHVIPDLSSPAEPLRQAAMWLVAQHPEWGDKLTNWFREQLTKLPADSPADAVSASETQLEMLLAHSAAEAGVQSLLSDTLTATDSSGGARRVALRVIAQVKSAKPPQSWAAALTNVISGNDPSLWPLAVAAARTIPAKEMSQTGLNSVLLKLADAAEQPGDLRIAALATAAVCRAEFTPSQFASLLAALSGDSLPSRSAAADALTRAPLTPPQLGALCMALKSVGPLELNRLLVAFDKTTDEALARHLLSALKESSALPSLRIDLVRRALAACSPAVLHAVDELESHVNVDAAAQRKRIEQLLPLMADGDVRRGHVVFYSAKAACSACHKMGYAGGTVGPELTHIGQPRTERDLLESILYPSLSFVRTYEPVLILTTSGKAINGRIRDETKVAYILTTGPNEEVTVPRADVEQIQPSTVSVMPAGLDKQLSEQELADLVAFLKNAK